MKKQRDILLILGSSAFVVIVWVIFSIYHNSVSSTISEGTSIQIAPINPNFDNLGIKSIKERDDVIPLYSYPSVNSSNIETGSSTTASSQSASQNSNTTSTESGTLQ